MIAVSGELLGPVVLDDGRRSATWYVVSESDVDLPKVVAGVAELLLPSPFHA